MAGTQLFRVRRFCRRRKRLAHRSHSTCSWLARPCRWLATRIRGRESAAAYMPWCNRSPISKAANWTRPSIASRRYESMRPGGIEIGEHCMDAWSKPDGRRGRSMIERCAQRMRAHLESGLRMQAITITMLDAGSRCNVQLSEARKHAELAVNLSEATHLSRYPGRS